VTFTPEKARELSEFATPYHVMLIPQYESLGHAGAVLNHEELRDLREAGGAWVFCTCEAKVWEFLGDVMAELAASFPNSKYIHVGGDEFEGGFGLCDRCQAKIAQEGLGGLYAEHMNKLNALVKAQGRTMLFWPSHGGPTDELSFMTLKNGDRIEKDMLPTEWIYHGPASYPEIAQYQEAGFKDVIACPAVVYFSQIYADYPTSFRGVRGFAQAGADRKILGELTTTWEFMNGGNFENSWLGLVYTGECAWSLGNTNVKDFESRWARCWLGVEQKDLGERIGSVLAEPVPAQGEVAMWRDQMLIRGAFFAGPDRLRREYAMKQPQATARAPLLVSAMDEALQGVADLKQASHRNGVTLRFAELAFRMMRQAGRKLVAFEAATKAYDEALQAKEPARCGELVKQAADAIAELLDEYSYFEQEYQFATSNAGAWIGDLKAITQQHEQMSQLVEKLRKLQGDAAAQGAGALPSGSELGFLSGRYLKIGEWAPPQMKAEQPVDLSIDVSPHITAPGLYQVEWTYDRGAHGVKLVGTRLLCNGQEVAREEHGGWAGSGTSGNVYRLEVREVVPNAKYEVVGTLVCSGGTDSFGTVWMVPPAGAK